MSGGEHRDLMLNQLVPVAKMSVNPATRIQKERSICNRFHTRNRSGPPETERNPEQCDAELADRAVPRGPLSYTSVYGTRLLGRRLC